MNYHNVWIFTYSWLNVVNQVLRWCPRMRSNFNWITTRHIPSIYVFYYRISNDNNVFLYFRLWASGWRSWKLTFSSLKMSSFGKFDSLFLSFRKALFPVVWLILLSFVMTVFEQRRLELELDYWHAQGWNWLVSAYSLCHISVVYFQFPKA